MESNSNSLIPEDSVFHPVWQRDPSAWFPGDEKTSALIAGGHIWDDILRLLEIRNQSKDEYNRKLLLKYICIELRSLTEVMDTIQVAVMSAEVHDIDVKSYWRGITTEDLVVAKKLWKEYSRAKKQVENDLINIRNRIAAHRDFSYKGKEIEGKTGWHLAMMLWDRLDLDMFRDLMSAIPPAFNHAKDLNIYEWNRIPEDGSIEILGGFINKWEL
ncbi:hypothetical protein [Limnothrix redekei]|uniref:HEPN AbiU2-like domain-containing protein n=1 Tax=Limnothrix redekei LRLZ20PSL1 TaxID=3112953 RepID=A0ABW7CDF3_9CYAN